MKKAEVKTPTVFHDFIQDHIDDNQRPSPSNAGTVTTDGHKKNFIYEMYKKTCTLPCLDATG